MRLLLATLIAAFAFGVIGAPSADAAKKCKKGYVVNDAGKCVKAPRGS